MNTKLKIASVPVFIYLLVFFVLLSCTCMHMDPMFNIGNNFDEPVTVYFEGQKMGKINPGKSKIFWPNDVLSTTNTDLLVELIYNSGTVLYSRLFTWDELTVVLESVHGEPYWIGDGG